MASYSISDERKAFPGKTDLEIAVSLAHDYGYLVVVRYKSSKSSPDYDQFGCCKHDYEVKGYFGSPYCHDTQIIYDGRKPLSCGIGLRGDNQLTITESFFKFVKEAKLNTPIPLGGFPIGDRADTMLVVLLKVAHKEFDSLCGTRKVEPILDFIPTENYPNLWFRLHIDDGTEAFFNCEYHFNILAESHIEILESMRHIDKYLMAYFNDSCTEGWAFPFTITKENQTQMVSEIDACRNGIALYHDLDTDKFVKGQLEIAKSRGLSGGIMNVDLCTKQSSRRLSIKPFPLGADIKFV
jgi:hypothetical protein